MTHLVARDLTRRLPKPLADKAADANTKLAKVGQAFYDALFEEWVTVLDYLEINARRDTATAIALRNLTRFWRSEDADTDAKRRYFLAIELWCRWGPRTMPELRRMLAQVLGTTPSAITITETVDDTTGEWRPQYYAFNIDDSLIDAIGFTAAERTDAIQALEDCLNSGVIMAGGTAEVITTGGGVYDTAQYDSDDVYG